jgi:hypothetical protein
VDILEPTNIERMIDHFVVSGDYILFVVMLLITSKYEDVDISGLHYVKARSHIACLARNIDHLEFYHKLMNSGKEIKTFEGILKKEKSKISWNI